MHFFCKQSFHQPLDSLSPVRPSDLIVVFGLCLSVALIYWQVVDHQFVAWDDTSYVSENARVLQGLNWNNLAWAFFSFQLSNWHPLTLISHMLDVTLWGASAGAHALVNVAFHAANAGLAYLFFQRVTGRRWASALVAALFAVHPLHVESVAWISERKDVLCAFFWLLAMHAYLNYWQHRTWPGYLWVGAAVALSLLSKPMAVTLPVCLLLIEVWLSGRAIRLRAMLLKAIPWFLMSVGVGVLTLQAQTQAMPDFAPLHRVLVAISAYGWYLEKTVLPTGLHFYYLTEEAHSPLRLAVSAGALIVLTVLSGWQWRRQPVVMIGWLWFLLTLLPVVGFIKVGTQAWADRYAYLPHLGLFAAFFFFLDHFGTRVIRHVVMGICSAFVLAMAFVAMRQVGYWQSTSTLYQRALDVNGGHYVALMGLANQALRDGQPDRAEQLGRQALSLSAGPSLVRSIRLLLGDIAAQQGRWGDARSEYQLAIDAEPQNGSARVKMGVALLNVGSPMAAGEQFSKAVQLEPDDPAAHNGLGVALAVQQRYAEAAKVFERGLLLAPADVMMRLNYAKALRKSGDLSAASVAYRQILRMAPNHREAQAALKELGG